MLICTGFKDEMLVGELICISYSSCFDRMPEKSNLKKEGLVLSQFEGTVNHGGRTR